MPVLSGRRMKGRGCVDDKALWCVWCVDDRCGYGKQVRGVHATVTSSARCIHVQGNYMSAQLVRMVQPWSYTFMHDSTKMHTLVFHSHTHALAHAYVPAAYHISLALTLETASPARSFMSCHPMPCEPPGKVSRTCAKGVVCLSRLATCQLRSWHSHSELIIMKFVFLEMYRVVMIVRTCWN